MTALTVDLVVRARNDLSFAAESLAGAWAALRSAGHYDVARPIVELLTRVEEIKRNIPDDEPWHDPADWYLTN